MKRYALLGFIPLIAILIGSFAFATTFTPASSSLTVAKAHVFYHRDGSGDSDVTFFFLDGPPGNPTPNVKLQETFLIKGDGSAVINRSGVTVFTPGAAFNTARTNYETALDNMAAAIAAAAKLNPTN